MAALGSAKKLAVVDSASESDAQRHRSRKGHCLLGKIKDRELNTRGLNKKHVAGLMESIAELGLIQALAIDQQGVLLAGGHRLQAIKVLKEKSPALYGKWFEDDLVPVTIINLADADDERERQALAIEVSENEKRRDYTAGEILQLAGRLRSAGYREGSGRLSPGEKSLVPALALVMGKSLRTARRLLADSSSKVHPKESKELLALRRCDRAIKAYLQVVGEAGNEACAKDFFFALKSAQSCLPDAIKICS